MTSDEALTLSEDIQKKADAMQAALNDRRAHTAEEWHALEDVQTAARRLHSAAAWLARFEEKVARS